MAISVSCHGCGKTLFTGREVISSYYVRARNECRCPSCGRRLSHNPISVQLDLLSAQH